MPHVRYVNYMLSLYDCLNLEIDYLPLIYNELLELKTMCKNNQLENNKNYEEVKQVCEKLASTIEEDDPFADGSIEAFDAEFPKTEKKKLKSLETQLVEEPTLDKKLVNNNFIVKLLENY